MKVIVTRFLGSTPTLPARIKASDGDGNSIVVSVDGEASYPHDDTHARAARALCEKMKWKGTYIGGELLENGRAIGRAWVDQGSLSKVTIA